MRVCLIFNPIAGTADRLKDVLVQLTANDRCELRATSIEAHAGVVAAEAAKEGFDRIVVAGGDRSVSQAINGLAPHFDDVELAVLPFGTGNDLARALGMLPEQLSSACRVVFDGAVRPVDVIRVTAGDAVSWCVNVANGGLGGKVAHDVHSDDKHRWGPVAYWMTSVSKLMELTEYRIRLGLDDEELQMDAMGVAVANGQFVGGGFPIAPRARLDDGLIDVTVCPVLPMLELVSAGANFTLGSEHRDERIRHYQARQVRIESTPDMPFSIDGESFSHLSATFDVIPGAVKFVVGPQASGLQQTAVE